jgi:hypothetical protein
LNIGKILIIIKITKEEYEDGDKVNEIVFIEKDDI